MVRTYELPSSDTDLHREAKVSSHDDIFNKLISLEFMYNNFFVQVGITVFRDNRDVVGHLLTISKHITRIYWNKYGTVKQNTF